MTGPDREWPEAMYCLHPDVRTFGEMIDEPQRKKFIRDDLIPAMLAEAEARGAAQERESCAKICEEWGAWNNTAQTIAYCIRSRGEE